MRIMAFLVSYKTPRWTPVAVRSYLRQWPDESVLVIDNNPSPQERGWSPIIDSERVWLDQQSNVVRVFNSGRRGHGDGMDMGLEWCRDHGIDVIVHFEPDCVIRGTEWRDRLLGALENGAEMAGAHRYAFGPIHPCPSAWRTDVDWPSFRSHQRSEDEKHPRFRELFDLPLRLDTAARQGSSKLEFWSRFWDTAQRAWFFAAVRDKAILIDKELAAGFKHYWKGSSNNRNHSHLERLHAEFVAESTGGRAPASQASGGHDQR